MTTPDIAALRGLLEKATANPVQRRISKGYDHGAALAGREALRDAMTPEVVASLLSTIEGQAAALERVEDGYWQITKDGPHEIGFQRRWLARQLLDSKLTEDEAYAIVSHHPDISRRGDAA